MGVSQSLPDFASVCGLAWSGDQRSDRVSNGLQWDQPILGAMAAFRRRADAEEFDAECLLATLGCVRTLQVE